MPAEGLGWNGGRERASGSPRAKRTEVRGGSLRAEPGAETGAGVEEPGGPRLSGPAGTGRGDTLLAGQDVPTGVQAPERSRDCYEP